MEVICLEDAAFYKLIDSVVERIQKENSITEDKWISPEEAKQKLRVKSDTTLSRLRNEGKIRYSQPEKRVILYDVDSIYQYLEKHAKNTF